MRFLSSRKGLCVLGAVLAVLVAAGTGCDETAVAGFTEDSYYSDYYDSYDSGSSYDAGDAIETYLGNYIVY